MNVDERWSRIVSYDANASENVDVIDANANGDDGGCS